MGSGRSYEDYEEKARSYEDLHSEDESKSTAAASARSERIKAAREKMSSAAPAPKRDVGAMVDSSLVHAAMTRPAPGVKRVHYVLVDNSGSNRNIANHLRDTSGYLLACMKSLDPDAQLAINYFSDHCDGAGIMQFVDWVSPGPKGDKILLSTTSTVAPMGGGDAPEAIECALHFACGLDFNEATERHLYLVTDVVAHGMGLTPDDGCPEQRDWRVELEAVKRCFTSFAVIGCGADPKTGELQRKFLGEDRLSWDFIDLSGIQQLQYRLGISGNALLFLIARNRDTQSKSKNLQTVELFLSMLYEKWLSEPIFGANTDLNAREAIERFFKYVDLPEAELAAMKARVIPA
jgi:hypothetical protein